MQYENKLIIVKVCETYLLTYNVHPSNYQMIPLKDFSNHRFWPQNSAWYHISVLEVFLAWPIGLRRQRTDLRKRPTIANTFLLLTDENSEKEQILEINTFLLLTDKSYSEKQDSRKSMTVSFKFIRTIKQILKI